MSRMRILPVVKAYPVIDKDTLSEAVCVAGITVDQPRRWVRLFPLDFRGLKRAQRFKKYEIIEFDAEKSRGDTRPESYTPAIDTIGAGEHVGTDDGTWSTRMRYFDAVRDASMCEILDAQRSDRRSLGIFRPAEVLDLKVSLAPQKFTASQEAVLRQASLLGGRAGDPSRVALEPLPVKAKFKYRCDEESCPTHQQSLIDWELGQLFRHLRSGGGDESTILKKIRMKFLDQYCGSGVETHFIVGSMLRHPRSFLVLGLVHPRRPPPEPPRLFEAPVQS